MDNLPLPLPDVGNTLTQIAGLSPAAQIAAVITFGAVLALLVWTRRPQQGPDAATVVETMRVTAQALTETSASVASVAVSMGLIAQRVDEVADDVRSVAGEVRSLTALVMAAQKQAA